jgi:hypothetical protein
MLFFVGKSRIWQWGIQREREKYMVGRREWLQLILKKYIFRCLHGLLGESIVGKEISGLRMGVMSLCESR